MADLSIPSLLSLAILSPKKCNLERLSIQSFECSLIPRVLKDLRRLSNLIRLESSISLLQIYRRVLWKCEVQDFNSIIALANDALAICELVQGNEYSDEVEYRVFNLLHQISSNQVLAYNQFQAINEILSKQENDEVSEQIDSLCENIYEGHIFGMHMLISLFCSFSSYKEQFKCLENSIKPVIDSFKSIQSLEMFIQVFNFLNTLLISPVYYVEYKGKVKSYYPGQLNYYSVHKHSFNSIFEIINIISEADILISQNLIKIIPRLWNIYRKKREYMLLDLIILFKKIRNSNHEESISECSRFLYSVFTDPKVSSKIKITLKSELGQLFNEPSFRHFPIVPLKFDSCKINEGFPLLCKIPAGEKFSINMYVTRESILYCAFVLDSYDIILNVSSGKNNLIHSQKYLKSEEAHIYKFYCEKEEILKIEWDNSYSWVNAKQIRYRVMSLYPIEERKTINKYNHVEVLPSPITVNAILSEGNLILVTDHVREEFYNNENTLETMKDFVSKIQNYELFILAKSELKPKLLKGLENVTWGIDIEILGLWVWETQKIEKVLVVTTCPVFRSCVVIKGKVAKNHQNFGNISEFHTKNIGDSAEKIINFFPGCEIVLFECTDHDSLKEELVNKCIKVAEIEIDSEVLVTHFKRLASHFN